MVAAELRLGVLGGRCWCTNPAKMIEAPMGFQKPDEAYSDVSFAPQGGRQPGCGADASWIADPVGSCRQNFTALSTAEAELVGYIEAMSVTV